MRTDAEIVDMIAAAENPRNRRSSVESDFYLQGVAAGLRWIAGGEAPTNGDPDPATLAELRERIRKEAGLFMTRRRVSVIIRGKYSGLEIETEACGACGASLYMRKVPPDALELLPEKQSAAG